MKKSLKKLAAIGISAAMALSLAGCGSGNRGGAKEAGSSPEAPAADSSKAGTQTAGRICYGKRERTGYH